MKDDLESIAYTLYYLFMGHLPWAEFQPNKSFKMTGSNLAE